MNEEISWDDVDATSYQNTEFITPSEITHHKLLRRRSTDYYEASWLEWFDIERRLNGQYGSCHHCKFTLLVTFGTKNDAGALGRCRLAMERHVMATHVTASIVKTLSAVYVQPVDPPF